MTRRGAKFRRFRGKMVKLKFATNELGQFRASQVVQMMTTLIAVVAFCSLPTIQSDTTSRQLIGSQSSVVKSGSSLSYASRHPRRLSSQEEQDPMEPCYLANNRASETLTISESTPVGTVVGEIMVIGELDNIELSIRMPGGNSGHGATTVADESAGTISGSRQHASTSTASAFAGTQRIQSQTAANGYYPAPNSESDLIKRSGSLVNGNFSSSLSQQKSDDSNRSGTTRLTTTTTTTPGPKSVRDLSEKIDSMPPLSLELGTKRLILAKKLDRENLDKYIQSSGGPLAQSSSASLTVHVKCQLKTRQTTEGAATNHMTGAQQHLINDHNLIGNKTQYLSRDKLSSPATSQKVSKNSKANSILIPVHLIITDENDNWPRFSSGPYIIDLNETAPVGSLLQNNEILASDDDQPGPLSTIEYSILQGSFWSDSFGFLNPLDSRSLIVKDNRLLDYESQSKITLKVMARDQGDPPNWAITSLYVNLLDQDDMNPIFNEDKYSGLVQDNRPGEKIDLLPRRMLAYDGDRTLSAPITYSFYMKTNHSVHFDLDPDLGQLTLKKSLLETGDHLSNTQPFCLLIKATQVDNPRRWSLTSVSIGWARSRIGGVVTRSPLVLDPITEQTHLSFAQANYTIEVSEAASIGSTLFTARANLRHGTSYQLLDNDLGYLDIDQNSGRLTLNKSLDYEMLRQLSVRILATTELSDYQPQEYLNINTTKQLNPNRQPNAPTFSSTPTIYPRLACDITRININVLNYNDYAPEFSHEQYNFQLSISDLIANFELSESSNRLDQWNGRDDLARLNEQNHHQTKTMSRRFGEIELADDSSSAVEEFDHKAIQLGQVYCADRDYGDKISLKLTGSRASLFHLTQDGRFYLPLINTSSLHGTKSQLIDPINLSRWGSKPHRTINNQLVMNRIFTNVKRSDDQHHHHQQESLDRTYLNYLLGELSNLGRLRLKVHASDGGQPETKQSTALIVISIISIDNFILQRSPHSIQNQHDGELIQLTNDTSYQTMIKSGSANEPPTSLAERGYSNQLMMIPSMNGKSFVHINPDIIGNLLSSSSAINGSSSFRLNFDVNDSMRTQHQDLLESSSSNTVVSNSLDPKDATGLRSNAAISNGGKHQPPGLLLVDDDGAKFVAMPTAMEVYNQQVLEAAAGQQARQKLRQGIVESHSKVNGVKGQSIWHNLSDKLGINSDNSGFLHWVNLSTAIALHLIVIACIISLATRVRRIFGALNGDQNDRPGSHSQPIDLSRHSTNAGGENRWPKRITNFGSFFVDKQASGESAGQILSEHHSSSSYGPAGSPNNLCTINQYSSYTHQLQHQTDHQTRQDQHVREASSRFGQPPAIVSSGVVVSARSEGQPKIDQSARQVAELSSEARNQQNLFDHLKLTLNKMLDSDKNDSVSPNNLGHVSVRPLDSDVVNFEDQRDRQLEICAQLKETNLLKSNQTINKKNTVEKSAISTFVGANYRSQTIQQNQQAIVSTGQSKSKPQKPASTVVSINVVAPKPNRMVPNGSSTKPKTNNNNNNNSNSSSNSSVVSLVSMSSSLSNKISEAVGRTGSLRTNGSDSTSLDSSILLQGCAGGGSSSSNTNAGYEAPPPDHRPTLNKLPPAPPPLPPPPSLVQATVQDGHRFLSQKSSNRPTMSMPSPPTSLSNNLKMMKIQTGTTMDLLRQTQPENPVHLRLRRDAIADQLLTVISNRGDRSLAQNDDYNNDQPYGSHINSGNNEATKQSRASSRSNLAVSGRRETRDHNQQPARTSSPGKSIKLAQKNQNFRNNAFDGKFVVASSSSSSNKTVSPTTSVDRGYESFQSFGFQPNQTRQFSSLQECTDQSCNNVDCEQIAASLPETNLGRRATRLQQTKELAPLSAAGNSTQTAYRGPPYAQVNKACFRRLQSSASSRSPSQDRSQMVRGSEVREFVVGSRLDCDTEDDDFYYYCGDSVHANEHQVSCFSYSNHAYNSQLDQPIRAEQQQAPKSLNNYSSGRYYKRPRPTTSASGKQQQQQQQQHSADLNMYPCDQFRTTSTSQVCDKMPRGRRGQVGPGRLQKVCGQTSQQVAGEMGVKKLTWSDQVN